ncbi:BLUF domain-containing protein [Christiangramia aquimixticola]|uniref:BLUF domain-containing protein n=1 Tax=Christiangramia aquimixticola TaxID=1697558 RepID=UPI003AA8CEEC
MRYAISYVSSVNFDLTNDEIQEILDFSRISNNANGITGILLYSDGNFFQVLEGDKDQLKPLFSAINDDHRHYDLMVIFEKQVSQAAFENYECDFISLDSRFNQESMDIYLSQIEKLNPKIQGSVRYVLNKFSEGIKSF